MGMAEMRRSLTEDTLTRYRKAIEKSITELKSRPWNPVTNHTK